MLEPLHSQRSTSGVQLVSHAALSVRVERSAPTLDPERPTLNPERSTQCREESRALIDGDRQIPHISSERLTRLDIETVVNPSVHATESRLHDPARHFVGAIREEIAQQCTAAAETQEWPDGYDG